MPHTTRTRGREKHSKRLRRDKPMCSSSFPQMIATKRQRTQRSHHQRMITQGKARIRSSRVHHAQAHLTRVPVAVARGIVRLTPTSLSWRSMCQEVVRTSIIMSNSNNNSSNSSSTDTEGTSVAIHCPRPTRLRSKSKSWNAGALRKPQEKSLSQSWPARLLLHQCCPSFSNRPQNLPRRCFSLHNSLRLHRSRWFENSFESFKKYYC